MSPGSKGNEPEEPASAGYMTIIWGDHVETAMIRKHSITDSHFNLQIKLSHSWKISSDLTSIATTAVGSSRTETWQCIIIGAAILGHHADADVRDRTVTIVGHIKCKVEAFTGVQRPIGIAGCFRRGSIGNTQGKHVIADTDTLLGGDVVVLRDSQNQISRQDLR